MAAALGVSHRMVAYYEQGKKPIHVVIARSAGTKQSRGRPAAEGLLRVPRNDRS